MTKFKLALAQVKPRLGDLKWNLERHLEIVEQTRKGGGGIVLFPELSLTGYSVRDLNSELALSPDDRFFTPLKRASKMVSIGVGAILMDETGGLRNALMYFEDGELKHLHFKVYLPTYGIFEEQRYFLPGKRVEAFDTKYGRIGTLICEDLWHVSLPYLLAVQGAKVILGVAASPTRLSGDGGIHPGFSINTEQHKSISRLLSVYLAFVNRVGFEDGVNFWGGSELISPNGDSVAMGKIFEEDLIFADVDLSEVERSRLFARHFLDEDPAVVMSHLKKLGY